MANCESVRKGSPRRDYARQVAADKAYKLLKKYGIRPTRYRLGHWHELAQVLFGSVQADLFDYIERPSLGRLIVG